MITWGAKAKLGGFSAPRAVTAVTHAAAFSWELGWGHTKMASLSKGSLRVCLIVHLYSRVSGFQGEEAEAASSLNWA